MTIEIVRNFIKDKKIKWTTHCVEKMGERDIARADVIKCISDGEIIEDYPDDYPHPSCLIYGKDNSGRAIHVVVGFDEELLYIVTAYIPNIIKFEEDLKTRRD